VAAVDEDGHEYGRVLQHRPHRRPDARPRRRARRRPLGVAVDAEELRVLARYADHVRLAVEVDLEVAVDDPAVERDGVSIGRSEDRREARECLGQIAHLRTFGVDFRPTTGLQSPQS